MFFAMNDYPFDFKEPELEKIVRSVAEGKMKKAAVAAFFTKGLG